VNAYLPLSWLTSAICGAILLGETAAGFVLARVRSRSMARLAAWSMTIAATVGVHCLRVREPAGVRMIAIILALLFGMKAIVAIESRVRLSPRRWLAFSWLWPGMRPRLFTRLGGKPLPGARDLLFRGLARLGMGVAALVAARLIWTQREYFGAAAARWLTTLPLLAGLSLMVHFGLFNLLAALWRRRGVDCRPLFKAPLLAASLDEFWSKRWNAAFSEMTSLAVYRPLAATGGRRAALVASFAASGLLHELAISVPVLAGFGGPSIYFLLHALLILIEARLARAGLAINSRPWLGRAWTLAAVVIPLPILFHRPFLAGVAWPIAGICPG
jgi:hypothetical protein